jgi:membrane fusion protein, multidrug efflux system
MTGWSGSAAKVSVVLLVLAAASGAGYYFYPQVFPGPALQTAATPSGQQSATPDAKPDSRGPRGPVAVEVADVRVAKASNDIRAIGSLQSDESVRIAPEISGRISEIVFKEGTEVKQGDVLFKLDDALAAAEVADAEARLALAAANNDRARALSRTGNVTGRGRDEAVANFETATAAAALAKTRLAKHVLTAPFGGIAGVRNVSVGAYVAAGTNLTNLEKIDVLKVDFKVPEIYLDAVKTGQAVEVSVDAVPGATFNATIYAINPLLDVNGRALEIRARLDNKDGRLRPGLFARILIKGLQERDALMVPEAAVQSRGGDTFIFVIDNAKAIERRVKVGLRADAEVEIVDGLESASRVVTAGHQKLRNGSDVEVVEPAADAARSAPLDRDPAAASGGRG